MSVSYYLNISTLLDCAVLVNNVKNEFSFDKPDDSSNNLINSNGLSLYFVDLDEEDKNNTMLQFGMSLNKVIVFSFRAHEGSYSNRQELICKIIVYILKKVSGDIFFTYRDLNAYLERRSGILSLAPETFDCFPELESMIDSPFIVKNIQIMELPDDIDCEE